MPAMIAGVRTLLDAGVPITAGTDAGIPNRPFDGLPAAVAFLADPSGIGMCPEEALRTATTTAARSCGLEDRGALRPGLRADLLAVDGDPLRSPGDLARTRLVVLAGEEVAHRAPALAS
jgi:imidazolonepropionase-like amidohydrolase